ncbi:uncharacterized protein LOC123886891 [Trifolium pratense]|uniref:uncharacterized protein LOC123886891 n=1 Tax=Trifolium pratense TaxID=57577 RepID=UPI001E69823D|nr:uncharacterized protein LOC123886891 [Trifolium pratense]
MTLGVVCGLWGVTFFGSRPSQPWKHIMSWVQHYKQANNSNVASHASLKAVAQIGWNPPEGDWIMLNTYGASSSSSGFIKIVLHIDYNVVVQKLQSDKNGSVVGWRIIQEIKRLLAMDWEVKICHSYRESNACVDLLANLRCDHEPGMRVYEQCPASLNSLLLADVM